MSQTKKPKSETKPEAGAVDPFEAAEELQRQREAENNRRWLRLCVRLADGWQPTAEELSEALAMADRTPAEAREGRAAIRKRDELLRAAEAAGKARAEVERLESLLAEAERKRDEIVAAFEAEEIEPLVSKIHEAEGRARGGMSAADLRRRLIDCCPDDALRAERLRLQAEIEAARREAVRHFGRASDAKSLELHESLRAVEDAMSAFDPRSI